jgi:hypothetical protein
MKISKKLILKDATIAYSQKIKPLISLENFDIKKVFSIIRQSTYQITGNEDILCEEKYDDELKRLLISFNDVYEKIRDESGNGVHELFNEIEESGISGTEAITEEDKKYFMKVFKNKKKRLEIINMVLATIFVAICLKSAGYKIKL